MKLYPNQLVKILFRNGTGLEGVVEFWEENNYILRSLNGDSILIIQDPIQDIMAVKVTLPSDVEQQPIPQPIIQNELLKQPIIEEYVEPEEFNEQDLKIKKLAELYLERAKAERETISNKLKSHQINEVKQIKYDLPSFIRNK